MVTIIMPAYNAELTIKYSIESVIKQTYSNWRLLVIDDSSTDNTKYIVNEFVEKDKRIEYFKNSKNLGVSETRNFALNLVKSDYVAFLDSDDIWEDEKLQVQLEYLEQNQCGFVFTGSYFINEENILYKGVFNIPQKVNYKKLLKHNVIMTSSVLIKNSFIGNTRMKNDKMHEDFAFWLDILKKGNVAYGINKPLIKYRISVHSKSGNKLKSIIMGYRTYKTQRLNFFQRIYYLSSHLINAYFKYVKIKG